MVKITRRVTTNLAVATKPGRGTAYLLVSRMAFLASGFLISIILARKLGPVEFGVYGVVMSILVWSERVLSAGVPGAVATLIPHNESQKEVVEQSARVLLFVWSLPLFVLFWSFAPTLADFFDIPSGAILFRIASLNIPLMSFFSSYEGILSGRRLFGAQGSMMIVQSITKLVGILVLLAFGLSVAGAFTAHVVATLVTIAIIFVWFPPSLQLPSKPMMRSIVRIALPMAFYLVALNVLLNLSLWQLKGSWSGAGEVVGFYVAGLNLTRILLMVSSTVTAVLFASLSWTLAHSEHALVKKYIQGATRFALVVAAPGCLLLFMNAEHVMDFMYGEKYIAGGRILRIQSLAFGILPFVDVLFHTLMAAGKYVLSASILVSLLPALCVLNVLLIPNSGGLGAAIALMIVLCVGVVIAGVLTYKRFGTLMQWTTLTRVAVACLALAVLSSHIPLVGSWLVVKLSGLLLVYLLILVFLRELTLTDLKSFMLWKAERS